VIIGARAISRTCRIRTRPRGARLTGLAALLALTLFRPAALAQVDRAGLNGTVTDSSTRVVPGARVIAVKNDSGLRRETLCSSEGSYDIPELPVGVYTVTFVAQGFQVLTFENVVQTIGQTRTLNAMLEVSATTQRVEVSTSSEQLDETSDVLGDQIEKAQVKELPIDGRNWATLTALAPGAVDTGGSNQRSIRFAGRGRDDDNFTYDGIDATNIINQAQQPYVRLAIPLDTIEEFRVNSMLATAESGATGGPQLAVTSPSGTNQFHGAAFEYFRNNIFDAQEPLPVTTNPAQPPFHLNQFGGSLGGPIAKNKTFFFLAYEGYRQVLGQTLLGYVPSDSFRAEIAAESPSLLPIVDAYPEGRGLISPNVAEFVGEGRQIAHEDSGMFRLDHRFTDKTTIFVRTNIDEALSSAPMASSGAFLEDKQQLTSSPVNTAIELLHIFSPTLLDEVKFGLNRSTADTTNINRTGALYSFAVSGFTTLNNGKISTGVGNSFSGIDNLTWISGRHTVKAGVEIRRIQMNQGSSASGTVSFASAAAFQADQVSTATLTGALPINGLRKTQSYGYLQDEFKWLPNLTLNLGARYGFFNIFHEVFGRANPFDFATCGPTGFCGVGAGFGRPNYGDFDPRVALAWAPRNSTRTVIRGGFGTYHEDGQLDDQNLPISNEVYSYSLSNRTIPGLSYPITPFLADTTGIISPRDDDRRRKDTLVTQWGASVERALPSDFVATVSFVGSEGAHLLTLSEVNVVDPLTGERPYPAFGQVSWRGNSDNSNYQALSVSLRRSFSHGVLLAANYQWSHEIDDGSDGSGDGDSLVAQNVACQPCERASGIWDVRHVFNANAVYQLPFGPGKRFLNQPGIWRALAGSWELTSVAMAHTGFPVNVTVDRSSSDVPDGNTTDQRPNLVPGVSLTPPGGSKAAQWINPAAFAVPAPGTFGDAPRDVARGPGTWQVDLAAVKHFPLDEHTRLEFRAECFNLFNHPQYGQPQSDFSEGPGVFGGIISTLNTGPVGTGTPRQMQFALRFSF
jgi:hypothetical protein